MGSVNFERGLLFVAIYIALRVAIVPAYKFLTLSLHPLALDIVIFGFATLIFGFLVGFRLKEISKMGKNDILEFLKFYLPALAGGLSLDLALFYLPVKNFAILTSLFPIVIGIYSTVLLKERPSKLLWVSIALAVIGTIIFKYTGGVELVIGDIFALVGIALFSFWPIVGRKYMGRIGVYEFLFFTSFMSFVAASILSGSLGVLALPPPQLLFVLPVYIAIWSISHVIGLTALRHLPAYIVSTLSSAIIPVGAAVAGIMVFGESLGVNEMLGGAVMVGAAMLASWQGQRKQ